MNSNDKNLNDIQDIEGFVKKLESNPDLIDNLSKERINILAKFYMEKIQENDEKIEKLKIKLGKK